MGAKVFALLERLAVGKNLRRLQNGHLDCFPNFARWFRDAQTQSERETIRPEQSRSQGYRHPPLESYPLRFRNFSLDKSQIVSKAPGRL